MTIPTRPWIQKLEFRNRLEQCSADIRKEINRAKMLPDLEDAPQEVFKISKERAIEFMENLENQIADALVRRA